ncbi:hypothetical protein PSACC_02143, partial [Paramicrosporidium saccamoebae]
LQSPPKEHPHQSASSDASCTGAHPSRFTSHLISNHTGTSWSIDPNAMGRLGFKRMGSKKSGNTSDRPLQTPSTGPGEPKNTSSSHLKLEEVAVSGRASPMKGGLSPADPSRSASANTIDTQKTKEIMGKVDVATKTMEQNIQAATQRGESLNELQDKSRTLTYVD